MLDVYPSLDFVDYGEEGNVDDCDLVLVAAPRATGGRVEAERLVLAKSGMIIVIYFLIPDEICLNEWK